MFDDEALLMKNLTEWINLIRICNIMIQFDKIKILLIKIII